MKQNIVHCVASCLECDWNTESIDGRREAYYHYLKTGHHVAGEEGVYFSFKRIEKKGAT